MNSRNSLSRLSIVAMALGMVIALGFTTPLFGQEVGVGAGWATNGRLPLPMDWSTRHVVYTGNSKAGSVIDQISKAKNDPRLFNSWLLQGHLPTGQTSTPAKAATSRSSLATPAISAASTASRGSVSVASMARKTATVKRDWSLTLGSGFVAPNMYPAKYNFDISSPLSATNCTSDFVVFGLDVAGSGTQANLVGVDELYSGSLTGALCGTAPNVKWAYNVTTLTGGKVTTSPILSLDGTQVAFVESNGSASVLHVLKWYANPTTDTDGTVAAPVVPTVVAAASYSGCTAPCMVSVPFGSAGTTLSSPFYDYEPDDTLWIGNDNGLLFQISGVFFGTPEVSTANGWSTSGIQVSTAVNGSIKMTGPLWDSNSGYIFVGGADGNLYAVDATSPAVQHHITIGSSSANGGGIVESPLIDGSNGTVFAFAAANAADVLGTTLAANTQAVVVQAQTNPPLGSPQLATIGQGSKGTTALNLLQGAFDNTYWNWSGSGANAGYLYMIGTAASATSPTLYPGSFQRCGFSGHNWERRRIYYRAYRDYFRGRFRCNGDCQRRRGQRQTYRCGLRLPSIPTVAFGAAPAGGTTASGSAVSVGVNTALSPHRDQATPRFQP